MSDEWLSVVNEIDTVIGRERRAEIHRLGIRHRAVHVFIFNHLNQLFLQKRSKTKDTNPGLWDSSVAGHVDYGEDYDQCVVREMQEELGIRSRAIPEHLLKIPACTETGMEFIQVYRLIDSGPFKLNKSEIDEGRWISVDEMNQLILADTNILTKSIKYIWRTMQTHGHIH